MNRRSSRNRHRDIVLPKVQVKKNFVDPNDYQNMVSLGGQLIPKHVTEAMASTAEVVRAGVPPTVVAVLAGAGSVIKLVAMAVARHAPPPADPDADLKAVLPAWAFDVLNTIGLVTRPPAPPPPEDAKPEPVKDDLDLAARAAAADIVIAS